MTLIIGYIYEDTVQIIADSAVTIDLAQGDPKQAPKKFTTFGELTYIDDEKIVEEGSQKILNLGNGIIIAFSGLIQEGNQVLEDLIMETNVEGKRKYSAVILDYFQVIEPAETQYLIGLYEDSKPILIFYRKPGAYGIIHDDDGFFVLGSGAKEEKITQPLFACLRSIVTKEINTTPDEALIGVISIAQVSTLNALALKKGVGGFFNGAYVNSNGIVWAKDTCNFLYSSRHLEKGENFIVNRFNRDSCVFVYSTRDTTSHVVMSTFYKPFGLEDWSKKWLIELFGLSKNFTADYYVFIAYDRRIVTVLKKSHRNFANLFKIEMSKESTVNFEIEQQVISKMLRLPENPYVDDNKIFLEYL